MDEVVKLTVVLFCVDIVLVVLAHVLVLHYRVHNPFSYSTVTQ